MDRAIVHKHLQTQAHQAIEAAVAAVDQQQVTIVQHTAQAAVVVLDHAECAVIHQVQ